MNREKSVIYTDRLCYAIALQVYVQGKTTPYFQK